MELEVAHSRDSKTGIAVNGANHPDVEEGEELLPLRSR